MKSLFFKLPEYVLVILALLAGFSPPFYINPIFLGIAIVVILQIIFKNRILGLGLGALFFFGNLFFLGALISEFSEFAEFSSGAKQLLLVGLPIWMVNMVLSVTMIYKYSINGINSQLKLDEQPN